jgi:hypothetical protein
LTARGPGLLWCQHGMKSVAGNSNSALLEIHKKIR